MTKILSFLSHKDCYIPLTPVWFSPPMLEMMDSVRPGNLDQKEPSTSAKGPTVMCMQRVFISQ